MIFVALFLLELFVLFLSSIVLTRGISRLLFYLSKSEKTTVYLLSFLFLPGTIIHELAHFLTAVILLVPVGEIEFLPKLHGNSLKLGSVKVARSDFFRRAFIGFAPLIIGIGILIFIFFYLFPGILNFPKTPIWQTLLVIYGVFQVSNTMFTSRKDVEAALQLIILILSIVAIFFIFHIQVPDLVMEKITNLRTINFIRSLELFLLIPLAINFILILGIKLLLKNDRLNFYY